jgi:lipoprotein-releasing system permease protein
VAIGATGTILGLAIGYGFAWIAGAYRIIPLDPQVYSVPYVPFHPSLADGIWITVVSLAISTVASLVPASAAAKLLPVDILRYE